MPNIVENEVVRNADYEVFLTNGAPGYLEYVGTALGRHVTIDAERGDMERCHRLEVRETRGGFEIHKASFERAVDWIEWRETLRERQGVYQNRQEAVESVKSVDKDYQRQRACEGDRRIIVDTRMRKEREEERISRGWAEGEGCQASDMPELSPEERLETDRQKSDETTGKITSNAKKALKLFVLEDYSAASEYAFGAGWYMSQL
jgi:hypothetical protein